MQGEIVFSAAAITFMFMVLLAVQMAFVAPSALAAEQGDTPVALTASDTDLDTKDSSDEYEGGTIPILRLTFADNVDPATGKVALASERI